MVLLRQPPNITVGRIAGSEIRESGHKNNGVSERTRKKEHFNFGIKISVKLNEGGIREVFLSEFIRIWF